MTWQEALKAELESWRRTPYAFGRAERGVGVDCKLFVASVLDAL